MTVAPSTVSTLYDVAATLLTTVEAAMGTTAAGAPPFSYVSLGEPAFVESCDMAIVAALGLREGTVGKTTPPEITGQRYLQGRLNLAQLVAYAMRCGEISEGNLTPYQPLTVATLSAQAKASYEDGWAVWNYVNRAILEQDLFGGFPVVVHMTAGQAFTPQAGIGGWRFGCEVELQGYDPFADT